MPKHLMLLVSLILLVLVPGCGWCKKKETKKAKARPAKKVKMEPIKLSDLYDFDEEEDIIVAEADDDDNYIRKEEETPRKF